MQQSVLIIDDEVDQCLLISAYLRKKDFRVDCAHTLEACIEKLRQDLPDNLLLDNNLPDGLGWKYATLIQGLFPRLHITLLTGGEPGGETGAGPNEFQRLIKPMRFDQLEACLHAA